MNSPSTPERRYQERRHLRVGATVTISPTQTLEVRVIDVSHEGMSIAAAANPRSGTQFNIQFSFPTPNQVPVTVTVTVQVVHSVLSRDHGGFKIGLRFLHLSPDAQTAINNFMY